MKFVNETHKRASEAHNAGNLDKAIELFNIALEQVPNHPDILSDRGTSYLLLEKFHLALMDFNQSAQLEPNRAYRYASRAFAKDRMGDVDGAIADYEKAIALDPNDAIAHNNLGVLLESRGQRKQAESLYSLADKLNKDLPQNPAQKINHKEGVKPAKAPLNQSGVIKSIFTRQGFTDFLRFVFNGFRLPNNKK
ncbi:MAG: tetratricopeptide repeat protein [Luteibaculum sp.]